MKLVKYILPFAIVLTSSHLIAEEIDNRTIIKIPTKFKTQILSDMRKHLETIQAVVDGLSKQDFELVAENASILGSMDHSDEIMQRRKMMPEGFRAMGPQMHRAFQTLARDARDFEDAQHSLEQLSKAMSICTACHQTYRLEVKD